MRNYLIVAAIIALAGCSTVKTLQATGGSKSDGIVNLSYEYGMFEEPVVQYEQGQATARARCKAWGYKDAESFDAGQEDCLARNGYGNCTKARVTIAYQCIGGK